MQLPGPQRTAGIYEDIILREGRYEVRVGRWMDLVPVRIDVEQSFMSAMVSETMQVIKPCTHLISGR